jgi:hypothetical protein
VCKFYNLCSYDEIRSVLKGQNVSEIIGEFVEENGRKDHCLMKGMFLFK